jgi:hypothetical protein
LNASPTQDLEPLSLADPTATELRPDHMPGTRAADGWGLMDPRQRAPRPPMSPCRSLHTLNRPLPAKSVGARGRLPRGRLTDAAAMAHDRTGRCRLQAPVRWPLTYLLNCSALVSAVASSLPRADSNGPTGSTVALAFARPNNGIPLYTHSYSPARTL